MSQLSLDPENAALSIQRRLEIISQCERYISEVVTRYGGLNLFTAELEKLGIRAAVEMMIAPAKES